MLGIQKEIAQARGGWKTSHTMNRVYTVYAVAYETLQEQLPKPNYPVQM